MFDQYIAKPKKRRPWLVAFLSFSVLGHVAVVVTLMAAGMWQVVEIAPPEMGVVMVSTTLPFVDPPPLPKAKPRKPTERKHIPRDAVQPPEEVAPMDLEDMELQLEPEGDPDGEDIGDASGVPYGRGKTRVDVLPEGEVPKLDIKDPPPASKEKKRPTEVAEQLLRAKLRSGNTQIHPPRSVRLLMQRRDQTEIRGLVRQCLDASGNVTAAKMEKTTTYQEYDDKLVSEMKSWRYEPYRYRGKPIPVCTTITFIYRQRN